MYSPSKEGVNILLNTLQSNYCYGFPDKHLYNSSSDRYVNELWLFQFFSHIDCVGYQQYFYFKLVVIIHMYFLISCMHQDQILDSKYLWSIFAFSVKFIPIKNYSILSEWHQQASLLSFSQPFRQKCINYGLSILWKLLTILAIF